ncbi:hypothetical protein BpJC7_27470 [Weizmannia acidilactici]|uniref:Uncharacterized protein n=1 Tax=Weizmannia acidilactici TaxID=2607726 RepID=A0A5J4JQR9_9BACI|nr:hypothetical protein [Weizmannia acidilactici]GER68379.1 hypothetical protein BpJC4_28500 [Weizmannia acidilactici]GER71444.1 hypothetical protein BpJC7_27470 [Weizmannia acidilactici]GER72794.1 hypothetical protein BpPP18_08610 [Weizmannia acidilactici]
MIYINQVFQLTEDLTRIRIVEIDEPYVYVVIIDANTSMPQKELYSTLITDIEQKKLIPIADPFSRVVVEKELTKTQIEKRDKDWDIYSELLVKGYKNLTSKEW